MAYTLQQNYHDAGLVSFSLGPRRELTLHLATPFNGEFRVRFGKIQNLAEVRSFFGRIPSPTSDEYLDEVNALVVQPASTAKTILVSLVLDCLGSISIACGSVIETSSHSAG